MCIACVIRPIYSFILESSTTRVLLSNLAKLFEKLLLTKISEDGISLNPLQGGFKPGYSSLHTAFILQEAIQSTREINKKAFVAFLDVRKAFDTVWHEGLFVKLYNKGIHPRIWHILSNSLLDLKLPSLHCLISKCRGKLAWKRSIKKLLLIKQHLELLDCCDRYLISSLPIKLGKPPPIWFVTLNDRSLTSTANFRARLLVGCDGLESDAARFRYRRDNSTSGDGYCKLCCCSKIEDPLHFLAICSSLESLRVSLISSAPSSVKAHLPNHTTDAEGFLNILLGIDWIVDDSTQGWIMSFIKQLRDARSNLLSNRC